MTGVPGWDSFTPRQKTEWLVDSLHRPGRQAKVVPGWDSLTARQKTEWLMESIQKSRAPVEVTGTRQMLRAKVYDELDSRD